MTKFTVDTNILIYSIDPTDAEKHETAKSIMDAVYVAGGPLPLQCLSEFYGVCSKKKYLAPMDKITEVVDRAGELLELIPPSHKDFLAAIKMHQQHGVPFFDALLLATARSIGCSIFLSEDLQDGRSLDGITIRNPFVAGFDLAGLV